MGEILAPTEKAFDPNSTLLWENISFSESKEILIFVPYSKATGFKGKFLDIYPIRGCNLCPASALIRLRKLANAEGVFTENRPVFAFKSGKFLSKAKLNDWLSKILCDFTDENHKITGHSFRSAIPTLLDAHPDKYTVSEIKEWGGWTSDSFHCYTKSEKIMKKVLFDKIIDSVLDL